MKGVGGKQAERHLDVFSQKLHIANGTLQQVTYLKHALDGRKGVVDFLVRDAQGWPSRLRIFQPTNDLEAQYFVGRALDLPALDTPAQVTRFSDKPFTAFEPL